MRKGDNVKSANKKRSHQGNAAEHLDSEMMARVKWVVYQLSAVPLAILHMELLTKLWIFGIPFDGKFIYLLCGSLFMGYAVSAGVMLFDGKMRRRLCRIFLGLLGVLFTVQVLYHQHFHTMFSWQYGGELGNIFSFIKENPAVCFMVAALFLPFELMCAFGQTLMPDESKADTRLASLAMIAALLPYSFLMSRLGGTTRSAENTPYYYYTHIHSDISTTYEYYGVLNGTRLELKQMLFGGGEAPVPSADVSPSDAE